VPLEVSGRLVAQDAQRSERRQVEPPQQVRLMGEVAGQRAGPVPRLDELVSRPAAALIDQRGTIRGLDRRVLEPPLVERVDDRLADR
jgi:hypothetical protein